MAETPLSIDADGKVPVSRIPSAEAARELLTKSIKDDDLASHNRAVVQMQLDGAPPHNEVEMKKLGLGGCSNLNFGEAEADMDRTMSGFNDMLTTQERSAFVHMRQDYGTDSTREETGDGIAIAYHKAVTSWEEHGYEEQMHAWYYNRDGVAVYLQSDERDPRWRAEGLDNFKIPRNIKATESKVEFAFCKHSFQVHELYKYIEDEATAKDLGWNVEACKEAIKTAHNPTEDRTFDWAEFQTRMKNNDFYLASSRASKIPAWDCFVREFDGTYSHHILLLDAGPFLFSKIGRYKKATEAFIISTYGIGTNGCYHGIRGKAYRNFPFCEHSNRIRNGTLDGAALSQGVMFESENAQDAQRAGIAHLGPYSILPPGLKPVVVNMPNPSLTALPVLADLERTRMNNTGGFQPMSAGGSVERKELEIQQDMASQSVLPSNAVRLYMIARGKMMTEQLRRLSLEDWVEGEPGYEIVATFRRHLKEMNIPLEALKYVDRIVPARALGAGSPAARQLAFRQMLPLAGYFDEIGRNNFIRDFVASEVGFDQVGRYVPRLPGRERPVIDQSIAELQNSSLKQGIQCSILDNEDHAIHLKVHVQSLIIEAHGLQQGGDPLAALHFFAVGIPHAEQHMALAAKNPIQEPEIDGLKGILTGLNRLAQEMATAIQKHRAQNPGPQTGPPQMSVEDQAKIQAAQASIALAVAESKNKMLIKQQEATQRMALRDEREAQNVRLRQERAAAAQETAQ